MNERGFIYVVSGESFVAEAARSAARVRELHGLPVTLISDRDPAPEHRGAFDEVRIELSGFDYADKLRMRASPYERTIFLDSDTLVTRPLDDVFTLLDRFDVAFQFTEGGNHYALPGVPVAFLEPSAGIIAWRRGPAADRFFDDWASAYAAIEREQGRKGAWDQRSLRHAAFFGGARIAPLPIEWQVYTYRPNFLCQETRMIHGRDISDALAAEIDRRAGPRVWLPRVGLVPSLESPRLREFAAFTFRLGTRLLRRRLRLALHRARIWRLPENTRPA